MGTENIEVAVEGSGGVSALLSSPIPTSGRRLFVYAPGAGSDLSDGFGAYLAERLDEAGIACLRFQFPYMQAGKKAPDREPVLEATWLAALEMARDAATEVVIGGRSLGGRIASQVVAQGAQAAALILFAYPLHPLGRPDRARDEHLSTVGLPVLFCSGTRDTFATPDELRLVAQKMPDARLHVLEGADHGFNPPRAGGRTRRDIWAEAYGAMLLFRGWS